MSDLIRREDAIATLCFCEETKMMLCKDLRKILERIDGIPSAELETFEFCSGGDIPCKEYDQEKHCCHRWTKVIRQTVEEMKSAESERKTGKWLHKPNEYDDDTYECSRCGEPWTLIEGTPKENNMNFCPNCGAEMRGE